MSVSKPPPAPHDDYFAETGYEQDARDAVQLRLGFASLVIWMVVGFGAVGVLSSGGGVIRPVFLLLLGVLAIVPAALPWLAFDRLVRAYVARSIARDRERKT
jgi:hypothetical protein